jgi:hypothetical protein
MSVRVVGLGAICDLDLSPYAINDDRQHNFEVSEFALLDNGEHVILHVERGWGGRSSSGSIWADATVETITRDALTTVLPDDAESRTSRESDRAPGGAPIESDSVPETSRTARDTSAETNCPGVPPPATQRREQQAFRRERRASGFGLNA